MENATPWRKAKKSCSLTGSSATKFADIRPGDKRFRSAPVDHHAHGNVIARIEQQCCKRLSTVLRSAH